MKDEQDHLLGRMKFNIVNVIKSDRLSFFFLALTFLFIPIRTALPLISLGLLAVAWLISGKFISIKKVFTKNWILPVYLFVLLPWFGLLYSKNFELGLDYALKTKYWLAMIVVAGIVINNNRVMYLLYSFWLALSIGAMVALVQYLGIINPIKSEHLGFGTVHTLISMYLIVGIFTASYTFGHSQKKYEKISLVLLIFLWIFHLLVLHGRNGYFVFLLLAPIIAHNLMRNLSKWFKFAVMLVLISTLVLSPTVKERLKRTISQLKQTDIITDGQWKDNFTRPYMVHAAIDLFIDNPIFGTGTGSLYYYTEKKGHAVSHPHNNLLYMGVSFGILGILSYLWLMGTMFLSAWRYRNTNLGNFVLSICLVIFLGGIFETPIINTGTSLLLPLGYGMLNHLEH